MQPAFVVIGDSMAGSRIDPAVFTQASGQAVAPLLYAGSGPAWWYLVLKNWVIPSGIRPKAVVVFFRDTNLTNVMFRIDATWSLDTAALDREDDLNTVVGARGERMAGARDVALPPPAGGVPRRAQRTLRPGPPPPDGRRRHAGD